MALFSLVDTEEKFLHKDEHIMDQSAFFKLNHYWWWLLAAINTIFVIVGQSAAILLGRFYYEQGGKSIWISTLVQTAAFPILYIPLFLLPREETSTTSSTPPSIGILTLLYFSIGVLTACDGIMYSVGLLYLSASTYSLICASQLAFNAIFSYFFNSQKFTFLIVISVLVLSLSSALIAIDNDTEDGLLGVSTWNYYFGFLVTLGASALYSLLLSLMQLSFEKVIKNETFSAVLEMQIYTSLVATCVSIVGLFASGEWKTLRGEMQSFGKGSVSYVMTMVLGAVACQVCGVGVTGLIFAVSSLFSNVIGTVALAASPVAAVVVFHDGMNGLKMIGMVLALMGFACFIYQNYLDHYSEARIGQGDDNETQTGTSPLLS